MKYALQVIVTSQEKKEHKLDAESALLSVLLPPTGVNFYANFVKFCGVKFHQVYKLEPIQKHCFDDLKLPGPPQIDPGHIWENSFFMIFGVPGVIFSETLVHALTDLKSIDLGFDVFVPH